MKTNIYLPLAWRQFKVNVFCP